MSKDRLEAFSDGVIAILITIMVLELGAPHCTTWAALRADLPVLLAYVLSFVYTGNELSRSLSRWSETNRERGGAVGVFLYRGQVGAGRAGCRERGQPVGGAVVGFLYRGQVGLGRAGCRERGLPVGVAFGVFFSRYIGVVHPTPL